MTSSLESHQPKEGLAMVMFQETVQSLKRFIGKSTLGDYARLMVMRMVLTFIMHRGRMSCSAAAGSIGCETVHRGQVTRFLARARWQKEDFNSPLRKELLDLETGQGTYILAFDVTITSQSGEKTENTYYTGKRERKKKGRRYKKFAHKKCHSFTTGLLITPSGIRIPFQKPHYTKEYCIHRNIPYRTTAEKAAEMIRDLSLPPSAKVIVLGDTAYDAKVVRDACDERGYTWIVPANPERVYEGPKGNRPKLRSRTKDWNRLPLKTVRLQMATGKYAVYRRLFKWRIGPKQKPRVYYAYQEKLDVRSIGRVQLVFSTMNSNSEKATSDEIKILMTNDVNLRLRDVIELYSLRWQIELFFKELKSTLGFAQYSFQKFTAVEAWAETALTTVLFLEWERAKHLRDKRLSKKERDWWASQRTHGLCCAFQQQCEEQELKYMSDRLKTPGGIEKLKRLIAAARPKEYRMKG
jgi:hypothetical protein